MGSINTKARNLYKIVEENYITKVGGTLTKIAEEVNIFTSEEDISMYSNTSIDMKAKEGTVLGEYQEPPEKEIEESEKYKLESTYAHEQLFAFAEQLDELPFVELLLGIFGNEIEISAISKLYKGISDKSIVAPEIIVSPMPINGKLAGFSNKEGKIFVWEHFIDLAIKDNDNSAKLLTALIEEYGHYLDYLLRNKLAKNIKQDEDYLDEGAKYAYFIVNFDFKNETILTYAKTETPDYNGNLKTDFTKIKQALDSYVPTKDFYDAQPNEEIEGFGAGFGAGMHGGIERQALSSLKDEKGDDLLKDHEILKIYYGNWLRDYSQLLVGATIRLTKAAQQELQKQDVKQVKDLAQSNATKLSHEGWVELLELLAAKEFIFDIENLNGFCHHYEEHLEKFRNTFGTLTKDILGIYRPEEHIDNPKDQKDESKIDLSFEYEYDYKKTKTKKLYAGEHTKSIAIDSVLNKANYFHTDIDKRPSSQTYLSEQLQLAVQYGRNRNGFRHLGAALHVLEDFFSHSNFIEIALIKNGFSKVYPWVEGMQGKKYESIPLVTGKFLLDDTLASAIPKVGDKMYPIGFHEYIQRKPGDRTFSDAFIIKYLENISEGQATDGVQDNPIYMGMSAATLLTIYNSILYLTDAKSSMVESLGEAGRFFDRSLQFMGEALSNFSNIGFNLLTASTDEDIKEEQTLHSNKNYGTNPTHTQLAKDASNHPLNPLAATLAIEMIKDVGTRILNIWATGEDPKGEALVKHVVKTYTKHPKDTDWADEIIFNWGDNKDAIIRRLESPTLYEHAHKETQRVMDNKKVKEILKYYQ